MSLRTTCQIVFVASKRRAIRSVVAIAVVMFFCVPGGVAQQQILQQQLDSEAVINHLNAVIKLYRNASAEL
jgi:hypothetical protein